MSWSPAMKWAFCCWITSVPDALKRAPCPQTPWRSSPSFPTPLADAVAKHYGVEMRNVLTGFKWIGDQIANLEAAGEVDRFIFGF